MQKNVDIVIIGAGIIGVCIAYELKRVSPQVKILVIDKEAEPGAHSSGRNSGVLHAGFYYTADSLKAKFTSEGNSFLTDYCKTLKLPINECGKLIVAKNEMDLSFFSLLEERSKTNSVELYRISKQEALKLEPRVKTHSEALWSPKTSAVSPQLVLNSLVQECEKMGVIFSWNDAYLGRAGGSTLLTKQGTINYGYLINCGGLYADKIASDFGYSANYRIIPFKGLYLYASETAPPLKRHIYPVPNLKNPFLGVHHTMTYDHHHKIGPTAIPAFWREQYGGLSGFKANEFTQILKDEIGLLTGAGFDFRGLALEEIKKYYKPYLVKDSATMLSGVTVKDYTQWGRPGIRAQLMDIRSKTLVMDFVLEGGTNSFHVLNAVSPAFTCSLPFAKHCIQLIEKARSLRSIDAENTLS